MTKAEPAETPAKKEPMSAPQNRFLPWYLPIGYLILRLNVAALNTKLDEKGESDKVILMFFNESIIKMCKITAKHMESISMKYRWEYGIICVTVPRFFLWGKNEISDKITFSSRPIANFLPPPNQWAAGCGVSPRSRHILQLLNFGGFSRIILPIREFKTIFGGFFKRLQKERR